MRASRRPRASSTSRRPVAAPPAVALILGFATNAGAQEESGTIVDVASGNEDFSILVSTDTGASNGVIHMLDTVITEPGAPSGGFRRR